MSHPLIEPVRTDLGPGHFAGMNRLRYSSDSHSEAVDGPVSLVSLQLTLNAGIYTSSVTALRVGSSTLYLRLMSPPVAAGRLSGGVIDPLDGSALVRITGLFHCYALCAVLGLDVSVVTPIQPITSLLQLPTLFTDNGARTLLDTTTLVFTLDPGAPSTVSSGVLPLSLHTNLLGREISRAPVPEPGTLGLLGVGLGALASAGGAGWLARRRRA